MNITVRDLNETVFRKFKAKAIEQGLKLGEALTQAMNMWANAKETKRAASLLDLEPFDWGKGTEKTSEEIDQLLYGERR